MNGKVEQLYTYCGKMCMWC